MRKKCRRRLKKEADARVAKRKKKLFKRIMYDIRENIILVEGLKDKREFIAIGCNRGRVRTLSGHMEYACEKLRDEGIDTVIVLTDMDRRGEELAKRTIEKLDALGIKHTHLVIRKRFAKLLNLTYWETLRSKIKRFYEKTE